MSEPIHLTPKELQNLTGFKQVSRQIPVLDKLRIPYQKITKAEGKKELIVFRYALPGSRPPLPEPSNKPELLPQSAKDWRPTHLINAERTKDGQKAKHKLKPARRNAGKTPPS